MNREFHPITTKGLMLSYARSSFANSVGLENRCHCLARDRIRAFATTALYPLKGPTDSSSHGGADVRFVVSRSTSVGLRLCRLGVLSSQSVDGSFKRQAVVDFGQPLSLNFAFGMWVPFIVVFHSSFAL